MRFSRMTSLTTATAFGLLVAPLAPAASAVLPLNQACSSGPYTGMDGVKRAVPGCTTRVSVTPTNGDPDNTSQRPRISEDGNYIVFQSGADNLVPDYTAGHGTDDYWVDKRDPAGTIEMVDRSASGGMPNSAAGGGATFVDLSGNGRYVVFYSTASNLTTTPSRVGGNVFLRDMVAKKTIEVVRASNGGIPNGYSTRPTISGSPDANGDYYVTYNSKATNLVAGITAGPSDIYVTKFTPGVAAGTVSAPKLVSRSLSGNGSNGIGLHAEISSDGNYIAFQTQASNISVDDPDTILDVYEAANPFLNAAARPFLVSVSSTGVKGKAPSGRPAINGNGDEVAFESTASNLVANDTNAVMDAFVRGTRATAFIGGGNTIRVSVDYLGNQLPAATSRPNLDGLGDKVGFASNARTVVKGDLNGSRDVFLRDLGTKTNYLIDVCQSGGYGGTGCAPAAGAARTVSGGPVAPMARAGGEDLSSRSFLSDDGLSVAFISGNSDLVPNDNNASVSLDDIFVRDFSAN